MKKKKKVRISYAAFSMASKHSITDAFSDIALMRASCINLLFFRREPENKTYNKVQGILLQYSFTNTRFFKNFLGYTYVMVPNIWVVFFQLSHYCLKSTNLVSYYIWILVLIDDKLIWHHTKFWQKKFRGEKGI